MSQRHFSGNKYSPAFRNELRSGHAEHKDDLEAKIENIFRKFLIWRYLRKRKK